MRNVRGLSLSSGWEDKQRISPGPRRVTSSLYTAPLALSRDQPISSWGSQGLQESHP